MGDAHAESARQRQHSRTLGGGGTTTDNAASHARSSCALRRANTVAGVHRNQRAAGRVRSLVGTRRVGISSRPRVHRERRRTRKR